MAKKLTLGEFINKAIVKHGNIYDYSLVNYVNSRSYITIICPICGPYRQKAGNHLEGKGCRKCNTGGIKVNTESFIARASKIHPNLDFSSTDYIEMRRDVDFICSKHGKRSINASNLLKGQGCKLCSIEKMNLPKITKKEWLTRFNKFDRPHINYDLCENKFKTKDKIKLVCKLHGIFYQQASLHARGADCPKCSNLYRAKTTKNLWSDTEWGEAASASKDFDSFKVYFVYCWNKIESFYKIGKTFNTLKRRFTGTIPYNIEKLYVLKYKNAFDASFVERKLHKLNKNNLYIPKLNFNGKYECYYKLNQIPFLE